MHWRPQKNKEKFSSVGWVHERMISEMFILVNLKSLSFSFLHHAERENILSVFIYSLRIMLEDFVLVVILFVHFESSFISCVPIQGPDAPEDLA